jgi:glycosyltransferase involved in cell wall biosynthesis
MGYHVIFIGDNFFKHEPYTTRLENLGIQVLYGSWYSNHIVDWVKQNADYMDYIYLCRPHIAEKYMDLFKKHTTAKIVYFTVDLHYLRIQRNYEIDKNPELLKSSDYWKNIEFDLIAKANTVHVVGSYEENILKKQFPNKDIRNIPIYFYDTVEKDVNCFENRNHLLFVGGFGHKPNVDGILWFISELFPKIVEHIPDIKLFIVGSNPTPEIKNLHSENVIVTGFVSDEELMRYYESSRVVVAPLRFGAGVKGKVVEAIANQIPLVTTSIGAEGLTDLDKVIPVFDDESNFIVSILDLYSNKEKWEQVSQQCGLYVHQYFTKETAKKIIEMDFEVKCNKVKNL